MACCGHQTVPLPPYGDPLSVGVAHGHPGRPSPSGREIEFEYVGSTAITVFGPYTGRQYRFPHPGARLGIEISDAASLAAVPNLRRSRRRAHV